MKVDVKMIEQKKKLTTFFSLDEIFWSFFGAFFRLKVLPNYFEVNFVFHTSPQCVAVNIKSHLIFENLFLTQKTEENLI